MIKRFCDNCGAELTEQLFRIDVTQYTNLLATDVYHVDEVCPTCAETVTKILRGWKES